jgi:hypothetical protein
LNLNRTLDTEGIGPGRSENEKNSRDQNGDYGHNFQKHATLSIKAPKCLNHCQILSPRHIAPTIVSHDAISIYALFQ